MPPVIPSLTLQAGGLDLRGWHHRRLSKSGRRKEGVSQLLGGLKEGSSLELDTADIILTG